MSTVVFGPWAAKAQEVGLWDELLAVDLASQLDLDAAAKMEFTVEKLDDVLNVWERVVEKKEVSFNGLTDAEVNRVKSRGYFARHLFDNEDEFN